MALALDLTDLSFNYPGGERGVAGLRISVPAGERIGIIGPSGAGKTTLLHLIDGLLKPDAGSIRVFEKPMTTESEINEARRRIGIVFQNSDDQLFSPTVFDDVVFGPLHHDVPPDEAHHRAHAALARVGLAGFEDRVPQHLSAGEKRKVALATVLAMEPELILFDEPTTSLDPVGRIEFIKMLEQLNATLLIASHDFELILRICDRVALLEAGRFAAVGAPEEILLDETLLASHSLVMPPWLPLLYAHHGERLRKSV